MTGGSCPSKRRTSPDARLIGAWVVGGACAWECLALASDGRLPTWSALAHRARAHPAGAALIGATLGVLAWHLIYDNGG